MALTQLPLRLNLGPDPFLSLYLPVRLCPKNGSYQVAASALHPVTQKMVHIWQRLFLQS